MIAELIVGGTAMLAAIFVTAWIASPHLRAWIERPKYQFHDAVQGYDRARREGDAARGMQRHE